MKKAILKICSGILVITLVILCFSLIGCAENEQEKSFERLTLIDNYKGKIEKGLLSTSVSVDITGKSSVTSVKIKMELQKLSSGSYSTIETWEQTFSSREATMSKSKTTNPLSTYRLKATVTAYSGANSESKTFYEY